MTLTVVYRSNAGDHKDEHLSDFLIAILWIVPHSVLFADAGLTKEPTKAKQATDGYLSRKLRIDWQAKVNTMVEAMDGTPTSCTLATFPPPKPKSKTE